MGGKGIGEQFAALDPLPHVLQDLLQLPVFLSLDQQVQGVQDRQASLDQRQKLLVKHQKRALLELAAASSSKPGSLGKQSGRALPPRSSPAPPAGAGDPVRPRLLRQIPPFTRSFRSLPVYNPVGSV